MTILLSDSAQLNVGKYSSRRLLVEESYTIYEYLLGTHPSLVMAKKYVRCIEHLKKGTPLFLPKLFSSYPILLALVDRTDLDSAFFDSEIKWRLNCASFIFESSVVGSKIYLNIDKNQSLLHALYNIFKASVSELSVRFFYGLFFLPMKYYLSRKN